MMLSTVWWLQNVCTNFIHYENIPIQIYWKSDHQKNENFPMKNTDIFHIFCSKHRRRGGSNEYPQSIFLAEIRKIMNTPVNPSFTI